MKRSLLLVLLAVVFAVMLLVMAGRAVLSPIRHASLTQPRVYAYRDWQSLGVRVHAGEVLHIRAEGTWMYTPGEYHGPEGHARYAAPDFYPLPGVPGGALLGRIGEGGDPFYVGRRLTRRVDRDGTLYLRIDDDILSDNDGFVTVEVTLTEASP
jgi:hypothetical protein